LAQKAVFFYTPGTPFFGIRTVRPFAKRRFEMSAINRSQFRSASGFILLGLWGLATTSGCMRRQMQINSFPEGAAVSVDHQPVGYTPVAVPFHYNGTREILLEKDGFKTIRVKQPIDAPWYSYPPFSLITDNFATREIRDKQSFNFQLEPLGQINDQQLTDRAENLRGQVLQGSVTPSMQRDQYIWGTR
jgi:hypothetical protein